MVMDACPNLNLLNIAASFLQLKTGSCSLRMDPANRFSALRPGWLCIIPNSLIDPGDFPSLYIEQTNSVPFSVLTEECKKFEFRRPCRILVFNNFAFVLY